MSDSDFAHICLRDGEPALCLSPLPEVTVIIDEGAVLASNPEPVIGFPWCKCCASIYNNAVLPDPERETCHLSPDQ